MINVEYLVYITGSTALRSKIKFSPTSCCVFQVWLLPVCSHNLLRKVSSIRRPGRSASKLGTWNGPSPVVVSICGFCQRQFFRFMLQFMVYTVTFGNRNLTNKATLFKIGSFRFSGKNYELPLKSNLTRWQALWLGFGGRHTSTTKVSTGRLGKVHTLQYVPNIRKWWKQQKKPFARLRLGSWFWC